MGDKTMSEKTGGSISEEDAYVILQRYPTTTVLTLLQEVAQVQESKMDWNLLVKHTKTGITNSREYQMLWRHLAYRDPLVEKLEDDSEPLDDDSDLEYELEATPSVSTEASAEVTAYVKVLMGSDSPSDSCLEKGLVMEAPLMINIPREKSKSTQSSSDDTQHAKSISAVNITVPVFVPTQILPTVSSAETVETNTCPNSSSNFPPRRKRKPWSAAEDRELFAAVQRCGEGNWANILKGDFKGDRTASQLSQRWNIIKKRQTSSTVKTGGSQLSEVQLAARRALNMALDKPGVDNSKATSSLGGTKIGTTSVQPTTMVEPPPPPPPPAATLPQTQPQQDPKRSFPRPQPLPKPITSGADAVKAAAVAAGARIATQSAAAAILKAQLKSAIHIKTGTNGSGRPPAAPGAPMGPDYFRQRSNLGSVHANPSAGPVTTEAKPSSSTPSPVEPVQEDQAVESGSKDEVQEEKLPES